MSTLTAISLEAHKMKSWRGAPNFLFAAKEAVLPLGVTETARAAVYLPLTFIRQPGGISLMALTGLEPGRNLYIRADGFWLAGYLPFQLKTYPFALAPSPQQAGDMLLCVAEASGLVFNAMSATPFFGLDNALAPEVKQIMDALVAFEREKAAAQRCAATLDAAGLIKPWDLTIPTDAGPRRIEGLHCIDEAAFDALDDAAFLNLRKTGALSMAYCQMLSMQHLGILVQLSQAKPAQAAQPAAAAPMELDFSRFGGMSAG